MPILGACDRQRKQAQRRKTPLSTMTSSGLHTPPPGLATINRSKPEDNGIFKARALALATIIGCKRDKKDTVINDGHLEDACQSSGLATVNGSKPKDERRHYQQ